MNFYDLNNCSSFQNDRIKYQGMSFMPPHAPIIINTLVARLARVSVCNGFRRSLLLGLKGACWEVYTLKQTGAAARNATNKSTDCL